jgi:C-terminal processing protease CtpA/Prc
LKKFLVLAAVSATLLLQACGGGGPAPTAGNPQSASCTVEDQRASLMSWMDDRYYWRDGLNPADLGAMDMNGFFDSMLAKPIDRYSFTQSTASFESTFSSGWRYGYGYTLTWDNASPRQLRVRNVEPDSPSAAAGIHRGEIVVNIDGFTPDELMAGALPQVTESNVPRHFVLRDAAGNQRELTVKSGFFMLTPLATYKTLDATRNGAPVKVGYMAYHQFTQYSTWQLGIAVANMASQGVSEFVLDLRYNGGGAVGTSRDLASTLSGSLTDGAVYARLKYNERHPELTNDVPFMTAEQRFMPPIEGLQRLVVITSPGTASASELLINGLRPFMKVVLVGDTTYGKPYGFNPRSDCGTTYNAVNFEAVNSLGAGGYSDGLPADCVVADDLDHQLGDTQERRLKEALNYIATGRCTAQAPQSASLVKKAPPRVIGETVPEQMFDGP